MSDPEKINATDKSQANQIDVCHESVAGEEDPGAALDLYGASASLSGVATNTQPLGNQGALNPGDEATAGTPGTGEGVCRDCGGTGQLSGTPCQACGGSGKVIVGLAGG